MEERTKGRVGQHKDIDEEKDVKGEDKKWISKEKARKEKYSEGQEKKKTLTKKGRRGKGKER